MKKCTTIIIVYFLLLLAISGNALANEKVAWFQSGGNSRFWPIVEQIMISAAKDLNLQLDIYTYDNDPFYMITMVKEVLEDPERRPDCILIHNFKQRGERILELSEQFQVPVFLFNAGFEDDDQVGNPRQKYPFWVGQMLPDDEYGGYLLAKELIAKAKENGNNQSTPLQMVALEGNRTSSASAKRVAGLKRALAEHPEVINNQFFHSKWKSELARDAFRLARSRYPETTIFWAASETMSIAVIEAAKVEGLIPGKDIITGGFDLLPGNKKYIESGEMTVSVGGHYFEAAWALVLIHDYLHGKDFIVDGNTSFTTKMTSQTKEDFTKYSNIFNILSTTLLDELDFSTLSRHLNPSIVTYDFSLDSFFESVDK